MNRRPRFYFTNQTVDRKNAREIELKIEDATGLELENPFYDGEAKEVKSLDSKGTSNLSDAEIVGVDLKKIRESDGIVALVSVDKLNIGSAMEIAICAHSWGKPVYVISPLTWVQTHPWITYFGIKVFPNHYAFIKFAKKEWPQDLEVVRPERKKVFGIF